MSDFICFVISFGQIRAFVYVCVCVCDKRKRTIQCRTAPILLFARLGAVYIDLGVRRMSELAIGYDRWSHLLLAQLFPIHGLEEKVALDCLRIYSRAETLLRVLLEQHTDQRTHLDTRTDVRRESNRAFEDVVEVHLLSVGLERGSSGEKLVENNTESPPINFRTVPERRKKTPKFMR